MNQEQLRKKYSKYRKECEFRNEVPEDFGWWTLQFADIDKIKAAMPRVKKRQAQIIEADRDTVWTPFGRQPINPEYLARHQATKDLREKLKTYAGSPEAASDLLFAMKVKSDQEGKDWTHTAQAEVDKMKGTNEVVLEGLHRENTRVRSPDLDYCPPGEGCMPYCAGHLNRKIPKKKRKKSFFRRLADKIRGKHGKDQPGG